MKEYEKKEKSESSLTTLSNHQGFRCVVNENTAQVFLNFGKDNKSPVRTKLYSVRKGKSWNEYFLHKKNQKKRQNDRNRWEKGPILGIQRAFTNFLE